MHALVLVSILKSFLDIIVMHSKIDSRYSNGQKIDYFRKLNRSLSKNS